ncbi:MAG: ribosome maturation factor RimM [Gemmatimonadetes bacterium]|nr:ribosome maturation factor RimM [Gemmatimonadota bacterium]
MSQEPAFLAVGRVRKPHGTRGELFVDSLTDHPGDVFVSGVVLRPGDADGRAPDPALTPLLIEFSRPFQNGWLVTFEGVEDRDAADLLRGRHLMLERERLPDLAPGEVFYHQLPGMEVFNTAGDRIGRVSEVLELRPADLLEVRTGKGVVLVPFIEPIVRELDVVGRRIVIDPPEGLLDS